jgi:hypothetical protein
MKTIIVGYGEIGKSLDNVLSKQYEVDVYDLSFTTMPEGAYEIMHVCFPYSSDFVEQVKNYKTRFCVEHIVIHSTVPVGTSRLCGAVNSPVVGIHPDLTKSLTTFTKFLGGEDASKVANYFRRAGMKVYLTDKQETTELMKIQDTTSYALMIEFEKDLKEQCDKIGVPYELWTLWCQNYNKGYELLGYPEYKKPILTPIKGGQNGHCTQSNCVLQHEREDSERRRKMLELVMSGGSVSHTKNPLNDRVWLYCEYWGKGKTTKEIGEELGCTATNVLNFMEKNNIPRRDRRWKEEEIERLLELHKEGKTFKDISEIMERDYQRIRHFVYNQSEIRSNYDPAEESKKEEVRMKISATLQGISLEEWERYSSDRTELNAIRSSREYKAWRSDIRNRDKCCRKCSSIEGLEVHHLQRFIDIINNNKIKTVEEAKACKDLWDPENGLTLCKRCHKNEHK